MKKIALVGAPCVGKTTLLKALKIELYDKKGVIFVEEAAREYFETHFVSESERFKFKVQNNIQNLAIKKEKSAEHKKPEIIICDRSVLDAAIYLMAEGDLEGGLKLYNNVKYWLLSYDEIFVLSPDGVEYVSDKIRTKEKELRRRVHNTYVEFLEQEDFSFRLLEGSIKERLDTIVSML